MRGDPVKSRAPFVLAAVIIIAGSCGIGEATAEGTVDSAPLVTLAGSAATYFHDLQPKEPVLRASSGDGWVTIVFDKAPLDVFSAAMPAGCVDEGVVTCCDPETHDLFVSVTYENAVGWVDTGELCDGPTAGKGIAFVPIPEAISRELAGKFGVDRCFMLLPESDGTPRVLVNAPSQDSWRWSYCFNEVSELEGAPKTLTAGSATGSEYWLGQPGLQRAILGSSSAVILVNHHNHATPSPPAVIYADPPACNCSGLATKRCHRNTWHLFYHDPHDPNAHRWTAIGTCNCPSSPCP